MSLHDYLEMIKNQNGLLLDRILAHPGSKLYHLLDSHKISQHAFFGNCGELLEFLRNTEDPKNADKAFDDKPPGLPHPVFAETNRLFHNFVASAKTLVDHTRVLLRDPLIKDAHRRESEAGIKLVFEGDVTVKFVHDIRNYMLHRTIPIVELSMRSTAGVNPVISVKLNLAEMSEWENWTAPSREFISKHLPERRIIPIVEDYEKKVRLFQAEFNPRFLSHYKTEVEEVRAMWRKFNESAGK